MIPLPSEDWFQPWMLPYLLAYCRVQGCFLTLPVFSERLLPPRVKICLAMAMTPLFAELVAEFGTPSLGQIAALVIAETLTGLLLGSIVRLLALALDIASSVIAMTASLSQIVGVPNEYAPHPIGNLLHLAGIALLLALGFPMLVADLLRESFILKPAGDWPQADQLVPAAIEMIGRSFILALILSAPFILGGFLFQALSGVISKVMPALPIVFIGAPAAILLALVGLALLAPLILSVWADAVLSISLPGA